MCAWEREVAEGGAEPAPTLDLSARKTWERDILAGLRVKEKKAFLLSEWNDALEGQAGSLGGLDEVRLSQLAKPAVFVSVTSGIAVGAVVAEEESGPAGGDLAQDFLRGVNVFEDAEKDGAVCVHIGELPRVEVAEKGARVSWDEICGEVDGAPGEFAFEGHGATAHIEDSPRWWQEA